jgi:hypothetical protein
MVDSGASVVKRKNGKPLESAQQRRVLNVLTKVSEDIPRIRLYEFAGLLANATGISKASICHVRKELESNGKLFTPKRTRKAKQFSLFFPQTSNRAPVTGLGM